MAAAAAIDFESFSSLSGAERVQSRLESRIGLGEFEESGSGRCSTEVDGIVGSSAALRRVLDQVRIVATTDATVLIGGETGTAKEFIAHAIHMYSERRNSTLYQGELVAMPAELLESELFGHDRGAFTGALAQRIGRFQAADGGTLFLDEIGDLPLALQAKLLRAVQEQEIERVGGNRTIRVDVRIVAATNMDLKAARVFLDEVAGEQRDVLTESPQGRNGQWEDGQPIVHVRAELVVRRLVASPPRCATGLRM